VTNSSSARNRPERGITVDRVAVHANGTMLAELLHLASQGELSTRVAQIYPFEKAVDANQQYARPGLPDRIVLVP
jgi:NADPH:quinone reductase-like Zn-dependent oxidoreductase